MKYIKKTAEGLPLYRVRGGRSVISTFTYVEWTEMSESDRQTMIAHQNVVVSGWPIEDPVSFDEDGLRTILGPPQRKISIQGKP